MNAKAFLNTDVFRRRSRKTTKEERNNNTDAAHTLTINTNLLNSQDRDHNFILGGSNTGNNTFAGVIGDSTLGYKFDEAGNFATNASLRLQKTGAGTWILSGNNSYSGPTTIGTSAANADVLNIRHANALGSTAADPTRIQSDLGKLTISGAVAVNGTAIGGHSSDRVINLSGTTSGGTIEANGAGPLVLSSALYLNVIPEPRAALLGGIGMLLLLRRRR